MSTAPLGYRRRIQPKQWCRNGMVPDAYFARQVRDTGNHVLAYRGKTFASWGNLDLFPAAIGGAEIPVWRFRCRTGHGAKKMGFRLGLAPGLRTGGDDPGAEIAVTEVGGATTTTTVHYGINAIGGSDAPGSINWSTNLVDVAPETTYEVSIGSVDEGVPLCGAAYEVGHTEVNEAVEWFISQPPTVQTPITDAYRERVLKGLSEMWLSKRPQLVTYLGNFATPVSQAGTTWKNVIDGGTGGFSASTMGYAFDADASALLADLCRLKDGYSLKCVLAAYAKTNTGSGGEVRFANGGGAVASLTGIGTTLQWYPVDVTLAGTDTLDKLDLEVRNSGANTTTVHAVSLYVRAA